MTKRRILFSGEAHWLGTGFATYNREILKRLYDTGKFEIAEFGAYGHSNAPEAKACPWKFYGNLPSNDQETQIYKSNKVNEFGVYKFDAVLADFQPDIAFDIRDPWMLQHVEASRFRQNYKTVLMPTVDSAPQRKEWIEKIFRSADSITTYSRYGKRVLEQDGIKVADVTSPGVDLDIFSPKERSVARHEWPEPMDITDKVLLIGTVMRNQKRKLFPQLFEAFAKLKQKYKNVPEVKRAALYCHTSWPDVGWDIPELLRRTQMQRHVVFTYMCDACGSAFPSWILTTDNSFKGMCPICGKIEAHMPNTHSKVSDEVLARIFQSLDIYIQPAICEGWGLPIVEAKSCGIPTIVSNYSAMEDHVENGGGLPLDIGYYWTESETMAVRTYPDIDDMVEKMYFLLTNSKKRRALGKEAREVAKSMHDWDTPAQKLEHIFESIEVHDRNKTWDARPHLKVTRKINIPDNASNEQFVAICYKAILNREPDKEGFTNWMNQLAQGASREQIKNYFVSQNEIHNHFELIRWKKSLALKDIDLEEGITMKSNSANGVLI